MFVLYHVTLRPSIFHTSHKNFIRSHFGNVQVLMPVVCLLSAP